MSDIFSMQIHGWIIQDHASPCQLIDMVVDKWHETVQDKSLNTMSGFDTSLDVRFVF